MSTRGSVSSFIDKTFRHFNSASLRNAAHAYNAHLEGGGKMLVSVAGAMSTAQIGVTLAEMIRQDKVHAISCTGANLEEDVYNLVARENYVPVPNWRNLSVQDEKELFDKKLNRVADVCIPENEAMRLVDNELMQLWQKAEKEEASKFPHEYFYDLLKSKVLEKHYQVDPKDSWLLAAAEKNIPMVVPGWEDSSTGNVIAAELMAGNLKSPRIVKTGLEYMTYLADWYTEESKKHDIGMFQIGGGIAGDFPICVVPLLEQDLEVKDVRYWSYFCQVSDSVTSFGSYSGAPPSEKITWGKLETDTPSFVIESDATIAVPLVFAYVLNW